MCPGEVKLMSTRPGIQLNTRCKGRAALRPDRVCKRRVEASWLGGPHIALAVDFTLLIHLRSTFNRTVKAHLPDSNPYQSPHVAWSSLDQLQRCLWQLLSLSVLRVSPFELHSRFAIDWFFRVKVRFNNSMASSATRSPFQPGSPSLTLSKVPAVIAGHPAPHTQHLPLPPPASSQPCRSSASTPPCLAVLVATTPRRRASPKQQTPSQASRDPATMTTTRKLAHHQPSLGSLGTADNPLAVSTSKIHMTGSAISWTRLMTLSMTIPLVHRDRPPKQLEETSISSALPPR